MAPGPADGAATRDAEVARALAEAPIERIAEVVYGSNGVFLLELDAPDPAKPAEPLRAVTVYLNCGSVAPGGKAKSVKAAAWLRNARKPGLMFKPPPGAGVNCDPERLMALDKAVS